MAAPSVELAPADVQVAVTLQTAPTVAVAAQSEDVAVSLAPANDVAVTQQLAPDVQLTMAGERGPQGEQGPQGVPGQDGQDGSGDLTYRQTFTPTTSLTVIHNLGKYPSVTVIDTAGDECMAAVDHTNLNQLQLSFNAAFGGTVICN